MELLNSRNIGEYFTYDGAKAYKFCFNKFVTDRGEVYTVFKSKEPKEVAKGVNTHGYRVLSYRTSTYSETIFTSVHQVVAKAFIENSNNYDVVDHINENKSDNRVENLRWTTLKGNIEYYNFKEDREIMELRKQNKLLQEKNKLLEKYLEDIKKEKEDLNSLKESIINELENTLKKTKEHFDRLSCINVPYDKYVSVTKETKGKVFGSVESMIQQVGKEIKINDIVFSTLREAARYLVTQEDCTATLDTIRKELRKLVRGDRGPWLYLGRYYIHI